MNYAVPTSLKILKGNPGHRPINDSEPKPSEVSADDIPDWLELTDEDKKEWRRIAPKLSRLGLLTELDLQALGNYCQDLVDARKLRSQIRKEGSTVEVMNKHGRTSIGKNPKVTVLSETQDRIRQFENLFGMNPVARTRIHVEQEQTPTDGKPRLDDFLKD